MDQQTPNTERYYMQEWARIEIRTTRLQACSLALFLGFLPLLWLLADLKLPRVFIRCSAAVWMVVWLYINYLAFAFRCPRCGKRFQEFAQWSFRTCANCGLQRPRRIVLES